MNWDGHTFGRWTVLHEVERAEVGGRPFRRMACVCECGTHKAVQLRNLTSGKSLSCGCLQRGTAEDRAMREAPLKGDRDAICRTCGGPHPTIQHLDRCAACDAPLLPRGDTHDCAPPKTAVWYADQRRHGWMT